MIKNIFKLLLTNKPQAKFELECQLMQYYASRFSLLRRKFQRRLYYKYHCDISHKAVIPASTRFVHPTGVVIGSGVALGEQVNIYQSVTLGSNVGNCNAMPKIGNNTTICAGAKIIGDVRIGDDVIVGANAVVTKDVPNGATVVGANHIIVKK